MLKLTVPLPLPLAALVREIQASLLRAVHAHPAGVVTLDEPVPPSAATDWLAGVIEYEHGAPAWVTVNVCPAIVNVPVRTAVPGFASIPNGTVPLPLPVVAPDSVNQVALLEALQVHPVAAVTLDDPVLAAAVAD
jgi:hypothetical protein